MKMIVEKCKKFYIDGSHAVYEKGTAGVVRIENDNGDATVRFSKEGKKWVEIVRDVDVFDYIEEPAYTEYENLRPCVKDAGDQRYIEKELYKSSKTFLKDLGVTINEKLLIAFIEDAVRILNENFGR